jgi:hypothetical protein
VQALAESVCLPRLAVLDLSYNDIDDSDLLTLARSTGLPDLTALDVSCNFIMSAEDAAELLSSPALPKLALLRLDNLGIDGAQLRTRFGDRVRFD